MNAITIERPSITQAFEFDGEDVVRTLRLNRYHSRQRVMNSSSSTNARKAFYASRLSSKVRVDGEAETQITYIDLFCGGGGLSLGLHEALRNLGFAPKMILAADLDRAALELVRRHFSPLICRNRSVDDLVEYLVDYSGARGGFASHPKILDKELERYKGRISLLIGGPPCQGHSNLNNRTRREDPRNLLYFAMPAIAVCLAIPNIIIENVPAINKSKVNVVKLTREILIDAGYNVEEIVLNSSEFNVAQTRQRHFLVASKGPLLNIRLVSDLLKSAPITFADVAMDLPALGFDYPMLERNGALSSENKRRIEFLQKNGVFELPNSERPDCHKDSNTYPSVYGRIHPDQPMQTVTTGFASPGRGRYVHPIEGRTITIREAGRIQAFPDWYWKEARPLNFNRADFQKIIGDAVPSIMIEPLVFSLFGSSMTENSKAERASISSEP